MRSTAAASDRSCAAKKQRSMYSDAAGLPVVRDTSVELVTKHP